MAMGRVCFTSTIESPTSMQRETIGDNDLGRLASVANCHRLRGDRDATAGYGQRHYRAQAARSRVQNQHPIYSEFAIYNIRGDEEAIPVSDRTEDFFGL